MGFFFFFFFFVNFFLASAQREINQIGRHERKEVWEPGRVSGRKKGSLRVDGVGYKASFLAAVCGKRLYSVRKKASLFGVFYLLLPLEFE